MNHLNIKSTEAIPFIGFWTATFGLAYASFRWLETPIRRKAWLASPRNLLTTVVVSFSALTAFGIHVLATDGASYRYDEKARAFLTARIQSYTKRCDISAIISDIRSSICQHREEVTDKSKLLLWGNSHASMLIPMLEQLAEQNRTSLYVNTKNNRPIVELGASNKDVHAQIMAKIKEKSITGVIFASSWKGLDNPILERQFTNTVGDLSQQNIKVWLVVDPPGGAELDPMTAYAKNPKDPQLGSVSFASYNQTSRLTELAVFKRLVEKFPNVHIIDASPVFCDQSQCRGGKGNEVWYRDATHLNNAGALAASSFFLPAFQD